MAKKSKEFVGRVAMLKNELGDSDSVTIHVLAARKKALDLSVQIAELGGAKDEKEILQTAKKLEDWMYR